MRFSSTFCSCFSWAFRDLGFVSSHSSPLKETTLNPLFHPFFFYRWFWNSLIFYSLIFKLWLVKHPFVRWGSTAQALVAVRGGWMWCGFRSARLQGFEAVCPPGASEQVGRAALRVRLHLVTVAAWGQCTWLGVLLALGCPGASPAAKAMAQARCWGAHAPSPPCSWPLPHHLSRHSRSQWLKCRVWALCFFAHAFVKCVLQSKQLVDTFALK